MKRTTNQPGSVSSYQYADLYAKVSGYLNEQSVDIGDRVEKGQLLASIYVPELEKDVARAAAQVELAKAQIEQANARVRSAIEGREAAVAQAAETEADIEKYTAELRYREKEYKRINNLYVQKAVDEKLVDEQMERRDAARAAERSARAALVTAKAQLHEAEAKIDQAKADLQASKASLQVDQENLAKAKVLADYSKITSPYTGVVTHRTFHVGDFIREADKGGEKPLLTVARTDLMRVVVQVGDDDVPYLDRGDPAVVTIATLGGQKFPGKISRMSQSEDPETRTMRTEIDILNPDGKLRDGMYGAAEILLQLPSKNLTLPAGCLVGKSEQGKASVYVVRGGKAHLIPVKVGADNGVEVEILEGLSPDDQVVLPHNTTLTEGQPVAAEVAPDTTPEGEPH
jgi:HlyD family secretion protein